MVNGIGQYLKIVFWNPRIDELESVFAYKMDEWLNDKYDASDV